MKSIGDRIKQRRKELKVSRDDIARYTGRTVVAVGGWERGEYAPSGTSLVRLAEILKTTPLWITKGGKHLALGNTSPGPSSLRRVPLISNIQAGKWGEIVDNFQPGDADEWPETTAKVGPRAFALRVEGDSMESPHGGPSFPPGMILVVDPDLDPCNGDFVVAKIEGVEEATFKKFVQDGGNYYLMPLNPQYDKIKMEPGSKIVGVLVEAVISFRR